MGEHDSREGSLHLTETELVALVFAVRLICLLISAHNQKRGILKRLDAGEVVIGDGPTIFIRGPGY